MKRLYGCVKGNRDLSAGGLKESCSTLPENLQFDRSSDNCVISIAIDAPGLPRTDTENDARKIIGSYCRVGVVLSENAHLISGSEQPEKCTVEGLKKTFQTCTRNMRPQGILFIHYSGHGIKLDNGMCVLAPMDFDRSANKYVTLDMFIDWLSEIPCQAKHIVLTLDCCHAGGIGKELTGEAGVKQCGNLYVLSACMANETCVAISDHSIFTTFFCLFLERLSGKSGQLPLREIFSKSQLCIESLSSLLYSYSKEKGFKQKLMRPQFDVRESDSVDEDLVDGPAPEKFQHILELYDRDQEQRALDKESMAYLDIIKRHDGPLVELRRQGVLDCREIVVFVFCCVMYSLASIEVSRDRSKSKVENANLFVTALVQSAATIDKIQHNVKVDKHILQKSWGFYNQIMKDNHIVIKPDIGAKMEQFNL